MVKSLVWSVVLFGAEIWTMTKEDTKRLEAFEMWTWRRIIKISWTEHQSNEEVLRKVQEERTLMNTIRKRQTNWIGHILRASSRRFTSKDSYGGKNAGEEGSRKTKNNDVGLDGG